jgi:hypothetical protein
MSEHDRGMDRREIPEPVERETRRATGMGNPGTFRHDDGREAKVRRAASGKLEEAADKVRGLGDQAASRHPALTRARPLAYNAAQGIEGAAEYVRSRELDQMKSDLEGQVRRHPLAAIGVAFLAGYAVRRLF